MRKRQRKKNAQKAWVAVIANELKLILRDMKRWERRNKYESYKVSSKELGPPPWGPDCFPYGQRK